MQERPRTDVKPKGEMPPREAAEREPTGTREGPARETEERERERPRREEAGEGAERAGRRQ
jgi:hypothetical protein